MQSARAAAGPLATPRPSRSRAAGLRAAVARRPRRGLDHLLDARPRHRLPRPRPVGGRGRRSAEGSVREERLVLGGGPLRRTFAAGESLRLLGLGDPPRLEPGNGARRHAARILAAAVADGRCDRAERRPAATPSPTPRSCGRSAPDERLNFLPHSRAVHAGRPDPSGRARRGELRRRAPGGAGHRPRTRPPELVLTGASGVPRRARAAARATPESCARAAARAEARPPQPSSAHGGGCASG